MIGIGQGLRLLLLILARRDIHEKSHAPRTAMLRRARPRWRRSQIAGGGSSSKIRGRFRFRGQSGHLMLRSSFSAFDPEPTYAANGTTGVGVILS